MNLSTDINGFNTKTKYDTKSVSVQIALDNETFRFEAICVPSIITTLKVKGINKIANLFEKEGDTLAYKAFCGCINQNISIILGVNTCHIVETKVVTFGHKCNISTYLESRLR